MVFNKLVRMDDADTATNTQCFAAGLAYYISIKRAPQRTAELKAIYEEELDMVVIQLIL